MGGAIVTIGNFDGVHRGHQALLGQVVQRARVLGLRSYAVTFEPHPATVLFPERRVAALTSAEEKARLIRRAGVDDVWVCAFTLELSRLEPADFLRLVARRQPIAELWVGTDFALGRGRAGTIAVLAEIGGACGWGLHVVPPYRLRGEVVSSTAIRARLAAGAVEGAAELLGRPYAVRGELARVGAESVLRVAAAFALPEPGVYAGRAQQEADARDTAVVVPPAEADRPAHASLRLRLAAPPPWPVASPASVSFLKRVAAGS